MNNHYEGIDLFQRRVRFLLTFCNEKFSRYFDDMKKILLLYTLNQSILPILNLQGIPTMKDTCLHYFASMKSYIGFFVGKAAPNVVRLDIVPDFGTWRQFAFVNFLLMYHLISKRTFKTLKYEESRNIKAPSLDDVNTKFYPFNVINLNEVKKKIKSLALDVKDHKFLAMLTGFLIENNQTKLMKAVLEESIMQPFDDNLIIKTLLCIAFYLEGDYFKCYQFVYQLLEKEKTHEKNTYIITYIASLLCLKHLDKPHVTRLLLHYSIIFTRKHLSLQNPTLITCQSVKTSPSL